MDEQLSTSELRELLSAGYRYACALRVDPFDAEDLVQESWMKVVRAYGTRITRAVFLRTIRNLYIDNFRRARRFQHVPIEDTPHIVDASAELAVLDVGDPQLNRCLARLRVPEREALFLMVVEGYTAEEVGHLTHTPRGTVLSLVHRARMKMQNYLMDGETTENVNTNDVGKNGSLVMLKGGRK